MPALLRNQSLFVGRDAILANMSSASGDEYWLRSSDGANWQLANGPTGPVAASPRPFLGSVRADGTRFLVDDGITLWTSFDGNTWTTLTADGVRGDSPDGAPVGCMLMPRGVLAYGASYAVAS